MKHTAKTISLPDNLWEQLEEISNRTQISRSTLVNIAVFNFFQIKNTNGKLKYNEKHLKKILLPNHTKTPNT